MNASIPFRVGDPVRNVCQIQVPLAGEGIQFCFLTFDEAKTDVWAFLDLMGTSATAWINLCVIVQLDQNKLLEAAEG